MVPQARSDRARKNDAAIRTAAIELILRRGIDSLSFREIGKAAGLSHGALYARFEDVEELLVELWTEVLSHRVISLFEAAMDAASAPSDATVASVLQRVRDAEQADTVAIQVLLLSRRFIVLREEVEGFIRDYLETRPPAMGDAIWSRTLMLFSLIMVKIFSNSEFGLNDDRLRFMQPVLTAALSVGADHVPSIQYVEPAEWVEGVPASDLRSQLAYSTYSAVGKSGYTKATVVRISRRANCSPGAIYKLFPSKEDLVVFASRRMTEEQALSPSRLASILDEGVLAQTLYVVASGQNSLRKYFFMEMMMASAHNANLRAAVAEQLNSFEHVADELVGLSDEERTQLRYTIREVLLLTLGVTFLSTVTASVNEADFAQFSEPLRHVLLDRCSHSWLDVRRQLEEFSPPTRANDPRAVVAM